MITQKTLQVPNIDDQVVNRGFQNVANTLGPVLQTPILDGVLVTSLTIPASGKLIVPHGLGRAARGYLVVYANNSVSSPYALTADQTAATGSIVLTFSTGAAATVSLWVF